jgi:hypothetical protein
MAVRGTHPEPPLGLRPDAMMTHEPFNAAAACLMPLGVQGRMDPWRAISPPMRRMNPLDLCQHQGFSLRVFQNIDKHLAGNSASSFSGPLVFWRGNRSPSLGWAGRCRRTRWRFAFPVSCKINNLAFGV